MPRVAKNLVQIQSYARSFDRTAVNVLASIAKQPNAPAASRVAAANSLLEWGWGKPEQQHSLNAEIQITIRKLFEPGALPGDACDAISQPKVIDVSPNVSDETPKTTKGRKA